jgi:hypothetical protein
MYVYVCAKENNFLNCCDIIYFVSGDRWIYVRLFLAVYWFLCPYVVLRKDWSVMWDLVGNNNSNIANCTLYLTKKSNQPEDGS